MQRHVRPATACAGGAALLLPALAHAHSFGRSYNLPIPLWLYIYGAGAALILSFIAFAFWHPRAGAPTEHLRASWRSPGPWAGRAVQALGLLALIATVVTGGFGAPNPYRNWSMTFFWIVFVVGLFYASALVNDAYAPANPWATLTGRLKRRRVVWPRGLRHWPAVAFYMGFIGFELFGAGTPRALAIGLAGYTAVNLIGAWLFGSRRWLMRAELFSVLFRQVARTAVLVWRRGRDGRTRLFTRTPMAGLMRPARDISLVVFILFMLSSTAFDGLKETVTWNSLYWERLVPAVMPDANEKMMQLYPMLAQWQVRLNALLMVLSPLFYLAVCLAFLAMGRLIDPQPRQSLAAAMRQLAPALIPIVVAYHASHYFTLLLSQAPQFLTLSLDPMGFGPIPRGSKPFVPDAGLVWHLQVGLILLGHVISVAACHQHARVGVGSPLRQVLGQVPLLVLMVGLTSFGLWVLAQPVNPTRMAL